MIVTKNALLQHNLKQKLIQTLKRNKHFKSKTD